MVIGASTNSDLSLANALYGLSKGISFSDIRKQERHFRAFAFELIMPKWPLQFILNTYLYYHKHSAKIFVYFLFSINVYAYPYSVQVSNNKINVRRQSHVLYLSLKSKRRVDASANFL